MGDMTKGKSGSSIQFKEAEGFLNVYRKYVSKSDPSKTKLVKLFGIPLRDLDDPKSEHSKFVEAAQKCTTPQELAEFIAHIVLTGSVSIWLRDEADAEADDYEAA